MDTNVLVKLRDDSVAAKHEAAKARLRRARKEGAVVTSSAVLGEVFHALTKMRKTEGREVPPIAAPDDARQVIESLLRYEVAPVDPAVVVEAARRFEERRKAGRPLPWFDCLHVSTAIALGCNRMLTWDADLPDGEVIDGLLIEHPALPQKTRGKKKS